VTVTEFPLHVVPTADVIAHDTSTPDGCICGPHLLRDAPVVVHNSLDGRELAE
jgi:hypothetical protein